MNGYRLISEGFLDILREHPFKKGGDRLADFKNRVARGLLYRLVRARGEIVGDSLGLSLRAFSLFLGSLDDFGGLGLGVGNYFGSLSFGFLDTVTVDLF